jgi:hypothetical protein
MAARRLAGISNRTLAGRMGGKDDSAVTPVVKRLEAKTRQSHKLAGFYLSLERTMSNVKM